MSLNPRSIYMQTSLNAKDVITGITKIAGVTMLICRVMVPVPLISKNLKNKKEMPLMIAVTLRARRKMNHRTPHLKTKMKAQVNKERKAKMTPKKTTTRRRAKMRRKMMMTMKMNREVAGASISKLIILREGEGTPPCRTMIAKKKKRRIVVATMMRKARQRKMRKVMKVMRVASRRTGLRDP